MKTLYLIRHAKSSWSDPGVDDFERTLSSRGQKDAPVMGKILKNNLVKPDCIIASPARRTQETAEIIAEKIDFPLDRIISDVNIYEASTYDLLDIITKLDDKYSCVFLIGHNPALTILANLLTDTQIDNIPTTGVFVIGFDFSHWRKVTEKSGTFILFDYPKNYR